MSGLGLSQGSCLDAVDFTEYLSPLYCHFHPYSIDSNCVFIEQCISDINTWMQSMKKMNNTKTEYILTGTLQKLAKCINIAFNIESTEVHVKFWRLF